MVAISYTSRSGTTLHQIEFLNIVYQGELVYFYSQSDVVGLPTRMAELYSKLVEQS